MTWYTFLIISHIIGTVLGVGGATFAEILYQEAYKDRKINKTEERMLRKTYPVIRIGMIILVLSGFGFFILYRLTGQTELLYDERFIAKMTIVIIIVINAIFMQAKKIPMWIATSISLTSWYAALVLGTWRGLDASFISIMTGYVIAIIIVTLAMEKIRSMRKMNHRKI